MSALKPFGIATFVGGVALLALAFAVGMHGSSAFAGGETPTVENGDETGTPGAGSPTAVATTPAAGGGQLTPTVAAGTPTAAATTPAAGGAGALPETGSGGGSGTTAPLLWLLGAGALVAGAGAVIIGSRQRS